MIPFAKPMLTTLNVMQNIPACEIDVLVNGPLTRQFEEEFAAYVGVEHAVAVSSCTAGLTLAGVAHGVNQDRDVLVPAMTHVATAHAFEMLGATACFGDVDEPKTQDVVTHFLGEPYPVHHAWLEDCAHALGATGVGHTCGVFSFYPSKHLTTGEGGMITTNDPALAEELRSRRGFGYTTLASDRALPGLYDVDKLGMNARMTEMQAALGLAQLPYLDEWLQTRRENFKALERLLCGLTGIERFMGGGEASACFCLNVVLADTNGDERPRWIEDQTQKRDFAIGSRIYPQLRNQILQHLIDAGIGATVHYATPVPLLGYYRTKYGYTPGDFPVAESLAARSISLPVGPHLGLDDMNTIAQAMEGALK